jgi:hypothetical protein
VTTKTKALVGFLATLLIGAIVAIGIMLAVPSAPHPSLPVQTAGPDWCSLASTYSGQAHEADPASDLANALYANAEAGYPESPVAVVSYVGQHCPQFTDELGSAINDLYSFPYSSGG